MVDEAQVGKYTAATKVLISFGATEGGFEFAMALRANIYSKFKKSQQGEPTFCYIDAASLENHGATGYDPLPDAGIWKMKNKFWAELYQGAMNNSKTMIIMITATWLKSKYCWQEMNWLLERVKQGKAIKPVFVIWPDAQEILKQGNAMFEDSRGGTTTKLYPDQLMKEIVNLKWGSIVYITSKRNMEFANLEISGLRIPGAPKTVNGDYQYTAARDETDSILNAILV